jgi:hypothetical protein
VIIVSASGNFVLIAEELGNQRSEEQADLADSFGRTGTDRFFGAAKALENQDIFLPAMPAFRLWNSGFGDRYRDRQIDASPLEPGALSGRAFDIAPKGTGTSIKLQGDQSLTITGAPGETVVLRLNNFVLAGDATFTLQGSATTDFIIKVSNQFSLSGNARINLSGVQWRDVLFQVSGNSSAVVVRGNASLVGTLVALDRTVMLKGNSIINGVVAARDIEFRGHARVIPPPITSP